MNVNVDITNFPSIQPTISRASVPHRTKLDRVTALPHVLVDSSTKDFLSVLNADSEFPVFELAHTSLQRIWP